MPRPPGELVDINILTGYWDNRCEETWTIYIEALYAASSNLVLTLLGFGLNDIVRGYFRPVAQRKWRHGRKARKGRWKRIKIPETGEVIAKFIPGQEAVAGRWVDGGTKWLWQVDSHLQRYLYVVLIHEVINDFWYDFNSTIITSPNVDCGNLARTMMRGPGQEPIDLGWAAKNMHETVYQQGVTNTPFTTAIPPGQFISILSATVVNNDPFHRTVEVQCRLGRDDYDPENWAYSSLESIGHNESCQLIATLKHHGPGIVWWEMRKEGGECDFTTWTVNTFQIGDPIV